MEYIYKDSANKSGIYKIANKLNNKVYIGSTNRFKQRCYEHIKALKNGLHQNKHLLHSFQHYGEDAFVFEVIEVMEGSTKEERLLKEEQHIQTLLDQGVELYNNQLKPSVEPKDRSCFSLTPEETFELMSKRMKEVWNDPEKKKKRLATLTSDEFKKGQSEKQRAKWEDPEYRQKQMESYSKSDSSILASERLKDRWQNPEFREKMLKVLDEKRGNNNVRIERVCNMCGISYIIRRNDSKNVYCKKCQQRENMKRYKKRHGL